MWDVLWVMRKGGVMRDDPPPSHFNRLIQGPARDSWRRRRRQVVRLPGKVTPAEVQRPKNLSAIIIRRVYNIMVHGVRRHLSLY